MHKQGHAAYHRHKSTHQLSTHSSLQPLVAGYSAPITGNNAEERLDLRCAIKTDKFCK